MSTAPSITQYFKRGLRGADDTVAGAATLRAFPAAAAQREGCAPRGGPAAELGRLGAPRGVLGQGPETEVGVRCIDTCQTWCIFLNALVSFYGILRSFRK